MRVGLDFDRVLFKTDEFNEYLKEQTGLHHVDADVYDEDGCYSPKKHAEASGVDVEKVYEALEDLSQFLYEDLAKLEEIDDHEFVIVTRGEQKFQRAKIKASGADQFVEKIFVVQSEAKDVGDIDFLVDDREKEIHRAEIPGLVLDRKKHSLDHLISFLGDKK